MIFKLKILLFLYNFDGSILMIRERSQKRNHVGWNFVKGTFEGGETIIKCARREALEEVGIELENDKIEWIDTKEMTSTHKHRIFFICKASTNQAGKPMGIGSELIEEIRWFSKEDILNMKKGEFMDEFAWELREMI